MQVDMLMYFSFACFGGTGSVDFEVGNLQAYDLTALGLE